MRIRPFLCEVTTAARSSTPMCCMNDGRAIVNGFANSLADAGETLKRSTTARRVGSASAWKMFARAGSARITLRHMPNYTAEQR